MVTQHGFKLHLPLFLFSTPSRTLHTDCTHAGWHTLTIACWLTFVVYFNWLLMCVRLQSLFHIVCDDCHAITSSQQTVSICHPHVYHRPSSSLEILVSWWWLFLPKFRTHCEPSVLQWLESSCTCSSKKFKFVNYTKPASTSRLFTSW